MNSTFPPATYALRWAAATPVTTVCALLGKEESLARIRTGIGNPPGKMAVADYVLKQLRAREAEDFQDTCARAADAAGLAIVHGVVYARDHVNGAASANGKH